MPVAVYSFFVVCREFEQYLRSTRWSQHNPILNSLLYEYGPHTCSKINYYTRANLDYAPSIDQILFQCMRCCFIVTRRKYITTMLNFSSFFLIFLHKLPYIRTNRSILLHSITASLCGNFFNKCIIWQADLLRYAWLLSLVKKFMFL